jgi:F-type H+-transporting ATPase subunit delta
VIKIAVARRYAKALFELLEPAHRETAKEGLSALGSALSDTSALKHLMVSPAFSASDKTAVLSELGRRCSLPEAAEGFLAQLVRKNRVGFLPEIAAEFAHLAEESRGAQSVSIMTAQSLSPAEQTALRAQLQELLRREVDPIFSSDPRIIAGLRIQIGSTVYDSTARSRLTALRVALTKE